MNQIIFITDGDANDGESDTKKIIKNVNNANDLSKICKYNNKISICAFGIGNDCNNGQWITDLNHSFLKILSVNNNGFYKRIKQTSADYSLNEYFNILSQPISLNINIKYKNKNICDLTPIKFNSLYFGNDLVICGKIDIGNNLINDYNISVIISFTTGQKIKENNKIICKPINISKEFEFKININNNNICVERIWAYLTLQQFANEKLIYNDMIEMDNYEKKENESLPLSLALKYKFITPWTSMIVVKEKQQENIIQLINNNVINEENDNIFDNDINIVPPMDNNDPKYDYYKHMISNLTTKLSRAKYVSDHLATEVTELTNPDMQQLEEDYREVEAELDDVTVMKEKLEDELNTQKRINDKISNDYKNVKTELDMAMKKNKQLQRCINNEISNELQDDDNKELFIDSELPLPNSMMNFNDNLAKYNPTKQQLIKYIDLMFNEWRKDKYLLNRSIETDLKQLILTDNIKLIQNKDNLKQFEIMITAGCGYWIGVTYGFNFLIDDNYPFIAPKVICNSKIYHPNIDLKGNVCLNCLNNWNPMNTIQQVIDELVLLFTKPNVENVVNKEVAEIFRNDINLFKQNVDKSLAGGYVGGIQFEQMKTGK